MGRINWDDFELIQRIERDENVDPPRVFIQIGYSREAPNTDIWVKPMFGIDLPMPEGYESFEAFVSEALELARAMFREIEDTVFEESGAGRIWVNHKRQANTQNNF